MHVKQTQSNCVKWAENKKECLLYLIYPFNSINSRYTEEDKRRPGKWEALGLSPFLSDSVLGPNQTTINCHVYGRPKEATPNRDNINKRWSKLICFCVWWSLLQRLFHVLPYRHDLNSCQQNLSVSSLYLLWTMYFFEMCWRICGTRISEPGPTHPSHRKLRPWALLWDLS